MKVTIMQGVKIAKDNFPHHWRKTYESFVVPRRGDFIEDPIWKDPYEYKVNKVTIDYDSGECYVEVENYQDEIPADRKEEFVKMASLHGWKMQ